MQFTRTNTTKSNTRTFNEFNLHSQQQDSLYNGMNDNCTRFNPFPVRKLPKLNEAMSLSTFEHLANFKYGPEFDKFNLAKNLKIQNTSLDALFEMRLNQLHQLLDQNSVYSSYRNEHDFGLNNNVGNLLGSPSSATSC